MSLQRQTFMILKDSNTDLDVTFKYTIEGYVHTVHASTDQQQQHNKKQQKPPQQQNQQQQQQDHPQQQYNKKQQQQERLQQQQQQHNKPQQQQQDPADSAADRAKSATDGEWDGFTALSRESTRPRAAPRREGALAPFLSTRSPTTTTSRMTAQKQGMAVSLSHGTW
ncbi:unnamed protein product [Lampetra planeri]